MFLPVWNLVFGTYFMPSNRRPETYGIDEYMPEGVAAQMLWPLRGMENPFKIVWRALRHPIRSIKWVAAWVRYLSGQMWRTARRPTANVTGAVPYPPRSPRQASLDAEGSVLVGAGR